MKIRKKNYSLSFDARGHLTLLENHLTDEQYKLQDNGEFFAFEDGTLKPEQCSAMHFDDDKLEIRYTNGIRVCWEFRDDFCEKTVFIKTDRSRLLNQTGVLDIRFADAREMHYHDDCTIWHCPLCCYARYSSGGAYFGLEYPYWDEPETCVLRFSPFVQVKAEEEFVSEKAFLGVYRKLNRTVSSHGPYPGKKKMRYDCITYNNTGLGQHFPGGKVPEDVGIPEEEQDLGEIRAMQNFFRAYLPEQPLPETGYWVWQNGWWAKLFSADKSCVDVLERVEIHDIMTAAIYYGHDNHPCTEPAYIRYARINPLGFPKVKTKGIKNGAADGFHHTVSVSEEAVQAQEYTVTFSAPDDYEELIAYGREHGVHISSFSTPNNAYSNAPEWVALKENGDAHRYFGTRLSCAASREWMEHHFKVLCSVFDRYNPRLWPFDGRLMGYHEICCEGNTVGEAPCYASNHGHLPGKSRYAEWKNLSEFRRRLRERYPNMCFEHYYGMKRGSTWGLQYFNSDENYYESSGREDNRFQTWHNEMDRFRPTYMQYSAIMGTNAEELEYSLISCLSTSSYGQCACGYTALKDDPKCVEVFARWRAWAAENEKYLKIRENLFGCPGDVPVDGSAHIVDGDGWIFLFNITEETIAQKLDLNDIPGLCADAQYEIAAIHPEVRSLCKIKGNTRCVIDVPARSAMVLRIQRT